MPWRYYILLVAKYSTSVIPVFSSRLFAANIQYIFIRMSSHHTKFILLTLRERATV